MVIGFSLLSSSQIHHSVAVKSFGLFEVSRSGYKQTFLKIAEACII